MKESEDVKIIIHLKIVCLSAFVGTLLYINHLTETSPPAEISYYYIGKSPEAVDAGLNAWNTAGFKCYPVKDSNKAHLVVRDVTIGEFPTKKILGEHHRGQIKILDVLGSERTKGVVAHEFGHFIGIKEHTTNPDSLMRDTYEDIQTPSIEDIELAIKKIPDFNRRVWFFDFLILIRQF
jgi:hypothetical protein